MKRGDRVELDLTDLSYFGDGVGHVDTNLAVFAVAGLPGERVVLEIDEKRRSYVRGQITELKSCAPDRVAPPCPYYGTCGGCQFQHLAYESQLRWKTEMVRRQFSRIPNVRMPDVLQCIGSVNPWRYRNNARFSVDSTGQIGFTRPKSHTFLQIDDCLIMQPEIAGIIPKLQGLLPGAHQIVVRYGARTGDYLIAPHLPFAPDGLLTGQESYEEILLNRPFRVSAPSFFQVNTRPDRRQVPVGIDQRWLAGMAGSSDQTEFGSGEARYFDLSQADLLALLVLSSLSLTGSEYVVDAYSGVGAFATLIGRHAMRVVGIEEAKSAVLDAEHNSQDFDNVSYLHGRTEDQIGNIGGRPDAVVLDPSRIGCDPRVLAALASIRPKTIVYVSCDPATLARDVSRLVSDGYEMTYVQPIDMFPQTHHIEVVSVLKETPVDLSETTSAASS